MIQFQKFKSHLLIVGLVFFILCFANSEGLTQSKEPVIPKNLKDINLNTLNSLDSNNCVIYINSDQDLINYSFPGSGSENNPYRIDNS